MRVILKKRKKLFDASTMLAANMSHIRINDKISLVHHISEIKSRVNCGDL